MLNKSNYLSWLREQQVLADKFSKEWAEGQTPKEQQFKISENLGNYFIQDTSPGGLILAMGVNKERVQDLVNRLNNQPSRQADYRAGQWFAYRQAEKEFLKEKDDMSEKRTLNQKKFDCEKALSCLFIAVSEDVAKDVSSKVNDYVEHLRTELESARAKSAWVDKWAIEILTVNCSEEKMLAAWTDLRALLTTINKDEKK